jgi:hypothetical protein
MLIVIENQEISGHSSNICAESQNWWVPEFCFRLITLRTLTSCTKSESKSAQHFDFLHFEKNILDFQKCVCFWVEVRIQGGV